MFIAYDRESYKGIYDEGLRITFDKNLRSRRSNLKLENDENNQRYFQEEKYLVEIKTLNSLPLWLARILSDLNLMPISFSKYGKIYESEVYNPQITLESVVWWIIKFKDVLRIWKGKKYV